MYEIGNKDVLVDLHVDGVVPRCTVCEEVAASEELEKVCRELNLTSKRESWSLLKFLGCLLEEVCVIELCDC